VNAPESSRRVEWSPPDRAALIASAQALKADARSGQFRPLLRGKHVGLLCEDMDSRDAALFYDAARELGATVARIRPSVAALNGEAELRTTALWLGRLYDAIECQGLPADVVMQLRSAAGVPVFDGIGCANHPIADLATALGGDTDGAEGRRYVVQALLASSI
jgi:ornithine carbamoyltransferase